MLFAPALSQNRDPLKTKIVTTDIENFWRAFDKAKPGFDALVFEKEYLANASPGLKGFLSSRIKNADNLAKVVSSHRQYYASLRVSTNKIAGMEKEIRAALVKLKEIYPQAVFPPVYFVIGALNSGGTASDQGLIIGAEMYGLTPATPTEELNDWHKTVIKPVEQVPHIVAHELIHFQQTYDSGNLLKACLKEGSADFIAELISGKHINQHVHDFANPREYDWWLEFKERMFESDFKGWLYSSVEGRPNDLGYWMGYQITKAYYAKAQDKKAAIADILSIRNEKDFLRLSGYEEKFK